MSPIRNFLQLCCDMQITSETIERQRQNFFTEIIPRIFDEKKPINEEKLSKILRNHFLRYNCLPIKGNTGILEQLAVFDSLFSGELDKNFYSSISQKSLMYIFSNTLTKRSKNEETIKNKFYTSLKDVCFREDNPVLLCKFFENYSAIFTQQQSFELVRKVQKNQNWVVVLEKAIEKNVKIEDCPELLATQKELDLDIPENRNIVVLLVDKIHSHEPENKKVFSKIVTDFITDTMSKEKYTIIEEISSRTGFDLGSCKARFYNMITSEYETMSIYEKLEEKISKKNTIFARCNIYDEKLLVFLEKKKLDSMINLQENPILITPRL